MNEVEQIRITEFTEAAGAFLSGDSKSEIGAVTLHLEQKEHSGPERFAFKRELLPKALRWVGGLVLLLAALSFTFQALSGDSLLRYHTFLGFTALMSLGGVLCALYFKDNKGARTFFGLSAAFLPAHFLTLGALLYSLDHRNLVGIPKMFHYVAPSSFAAWGTLGVALLALVPIAFAGLSSLCRSEAKRLTVYYLLLNLALLLPFRGPDIVALLVLVLFGLNVYFEAGVLSKKPVLMNWEGQMVRTMLFVPVIGMALRTLVVHDVSLLLGSAILACVGAMFFDVFPRRELEESGRSRLGLTNMESQAIGSFFLLGALHNAIVAIFAPQYIGYANLLWKDYCILIQFIPVGLLLFTLSFLGYGSGINYRRIASGLMVSCGIAQILLIGGVASSLALLLVAIGLLTSAYLLEERGVLYPSLLGFSVVIPHQVYLAISTITLSPWIILAVVGSSSILFSSYIEKNYQNLLGAMSTARTRLKSWD